VREQDGLKAVDRRGRRTRRLLCGDIRAASVEWSRLRSFSTRGGAPEGGQQKKDVLLVFCQSRLVS
jgi:hypothetical protein